MAISSDCCSALPIHNSRDIAPRPLSVSATMTVAGCTPAANDTGCVSAIRRIGSSR